MGTQAIFDRTLAMKAGAQCLQGLRVTDDYEYRSLIVPAIGEKLHLADYGDDECCCVDFNAWGSTHAKLKSWLIQNNIPYREI